MIDNGEDSFITRTIVFTWVFLIGFVIFGILHLIRFTWIFVEAMKNGFDGMKESEPKAKEE